jgi:hypothetical protein
MLFGEKKLVTMLTTKNCYYAATATRKVSAHRLPPLPTCAMISFALKEAECVQWYRRPALVAQLGQRL